MLNSKLKKKKYIFLFYLSKKQFIFKKRKKAFPITNKIETKMKLIFKIKQEKKHREEKGLGLWLSTKEEKPAKEYSHNNHYYYYYLLIYIVYIYSFFFFNFF